MEQEEYFKKCGQEPKDNKTDKKEELKGMYLLPAKIFRLFHNNNILDSNIADDSSDVVALPRTEVIQRLRDRGEPILLYGETELEAFRRLRRCEILEPEVNRVSTKSYV